MDSFLEIVFSIVGVLLYWLFSTRKTKQKPKRPKPKRRPVNLDGEGDRQQRHAEHETEQPDFQQHDERMDDDFREREEPRESEVSDPWAQQETEAEQRKATGPSTFEELLRQFMAPEPPKKKPPKPVPDWQEAYDDDYEPLLRPDEAPKTLQEIKEERVKAAEREKSAGHRAKKKLKPLIKKAEEIHKSTKKKNVTAKSLRRRIHNPQDLKEMFLFKEIFDRKEF